MWDSNINGILYSSVNKLVTWVRKMTVARKVKSNWSLNNKILKMTLQKLLLLYNYATNASICATAACLLMKKMRCSTLYQIKMSKTMLRSSVLVLADHCDETNTFQAFLRRKDKARPTCVIHLGGVLFVPPSKTENWALRTLLQKKQESLGCLSREYSRPFFVCGHCNETSQKCPTIKTYCVD